MTLKSVVGGFEKISRPSRYTKEASDIKTRGRKLNKVKRDNSNKRFVEPPTKGYDDYNGEYNAYEY